MHSSEIDFGTLEDCLFEGEDRVDGLFNDGLERLRETWARSVYVVGELDISELIGVGRRPVDSADALIEGSRIVKVARSFVGEAAKEWRESRRLEVVHQKMCHKMIRTTTIPIPISIFFMVLILLICNY